MNSDGGFVYPSRWQNELLQLSHWLFVLSAPSRKESRSSPYLDGIYGGGFKVAENGRWVDATIHLVALVNHRLQPYKS